MSSNRKFRTLSAIVALPSKVLLGGIRLYQLTLSPVLPVMFGPNCGCRFHPTCSHYAAEAVRTHGAIKGTALGAWRLLKCNPLHEGGFDPVPPRPSVSRPICQRVTPPPAGAR